MRLLLLLATVQRAACALALGMLCLTFIPGHAHASGTAVSVTDDSGRSVSLARPAGRIVSLAPHATEILFAAGAGERVVGVVDHSDYPRAAREIPSVGSGIALDLERILALRPDLVVAWSSGNASAQITRLRELGVPVFESEPRDFLAIARTTERLARLAGTELVGNAAARDFQDKLAGLEQQYSKRPTLTVFYQIWQAPLMTLNGQHLVSQALRLCGARNVFAHLPQLTPTISIEAVVQADPDVIIASSGEESDALAMWRRFPGMRAVAADRMRVIDGSLLNRSGPRILEGAETLCKELDKMRP